MCAVCVSRIESFLTVNLRRVLAPFTEGEYGRVVAALEASRRKVPFLLLGYVLMPDRWHALIWAGIR